MIEKTHSQQGTGMMNKLILLLALLLVPQLASARVFMCVDLDTGDTSFTDKACETAALREEVRVDPTNLDSGGRAAAKPREKTWRSEEETRKTGLDFNASRRGIYENRATASTK